MVTLAAVVWRVLPVFTGPVLPAGATRLEIATEPPNFNTGCAAAALGPVRVATLGAKLVLVGVASDETIEVVWPAGFAAWRVSGRAVVADPWGNVVAQDEDVLDNLGGG